MFQRCIHSISSKHISHALTHSSLAVGVGVDLAIVLDDGQTGRDGGRHLILAVLCAGAAGGLLAAAVVAIKHPE